MKHYYTPIILSLILTLTACNNSKSSEMERSEEKVQRTLAEDQQILDERIASTNKIWDSLDGILNRENLDPEYRDSVKALFFKNRYEQEEIFKDFIKENPSSEISIKNLNGFKFTWGKETTTDLFEGMSGEIKDSEEGELVAKYLEYYNNPQVNDQFTDFELPDLKGDNILISENLNDYTLLEFWASWCYGCRKKHPELIEVYEDFKNKGFTVIGISGDNYEGDWVKAVEKDELPWLNLRDPNGRESIVQFKYGIHYLPANFLVGPDGRIIAKDVNPDELSQILDELVSSAISSI